MPNNKGKSRVEIFEAEVNNWIISSWHKDHTHAIINADVISKSRNCMARVIDAGKIIHMVGGEDQ
jgi:hypothetical protein